MDDSYPQVRASVSATDNIGLSISSKPDYQVTLGN